MIRHLVGHLYSVYHKLPVKIQVVISYFIQKYKLYKLVNNNRVVVDTINGIRYELDLNELIDSSIYYEGCFEPMTTAVIEKHVRKDMTVIDIGANMGCHTLRFAKLVGQSGKVIAFEPMSWAFSKLKRNVELNNFKNIVLERKALSDVNQKQLAFFQSNYPLDGSSSNGNKEDIVFITLDEYILNNRIDRIDFIKIDVDGYEYKIIQGGIDTLRIFKPIMIIELGKHTLTKFGNNPEDLIELLASLGYSFYSEKDLKQYDSKQSLLNAIPRDRTINVLCKMTVKN